MTHRDKEPKRSSYREELTDESDEDKPTVLLMTCALCPVVELLTYPGGTGPHDEEEGQDHIENCKPQ
jgi:hypothetical protein